jgi:2-hydroxy-6-oxonona-2,4-dienedioate hydrolase
MLQAAQQIGSGKMKMDGNICARLGVQERLRFDWRVLFTGVAVFLLLSVFGVSSARAELTTNGEVAGLRAQFIDVNGIRTRYYEMGEGEPLVLVHGGGWSGHSSANVWSKNIPLFAQRFHVFAPDKLGSGMTENPTDDNELNIQGEVDHIYDFIRAMKLGMVHLVGQSRGGGCVFFLALQHPEVVRDLVIVDSNTAAPDGPSTRDDALSRCPKEPDWEAWRCRIRSISYSREEAFDDEYFMAGKYMSLLPKSQETAAKVKAGAGGELATTDGFSRWKAEWHERIRKEGVLQVPVLLYWGADDPSSDVANGRALHDLIAEKNPHVRMIVVDKAGHFPFREYPEDFVSKVTDFFDHPNDPQVDVHPTGQGR